MMNARTDTEVSDYVESVIRGFRREYDNVGYDVRTGHMNAFTGGPDAVAEFARNERGRDWIVGDIHGLFGVLEKALAKIGFDPDTDRLFCVGDLIDRGPENEAALDWLRRSWFHSLRGNHDQMMVDALFGDESIRPHIMDIWYMNGGDWCERASPRRVLDIAALLSRLPLAMEIHQSDGTRVGLVHADAPYGMDWETLKTRLVSGDRLTAMSALWSRCRISAMYDACHGKVAGPAMGEDGKAATEELVSVPGIETVVSGHTVLREPMKSGNRVWIDTGAALARTDRPAFTFVRPGSEPISLGVTRLEYEGCHDVKDKEGHVPLHHMAIAGNFQAVRELLAMGAYPDSLTSGKRTPLHFAAGSGSVNMVMALLDAGANPDVVDAIGMRPLHIAAGADPETDGNLNIGALTRAGADPDAATESDGLTPLHIACALGSPDSVVALLDAGADPSLRTNRGQTPLEIASYNTGLPGTVAYRRLERAAAAHGIRTSSE